MNHQNRMPRGYYPVRCAESPVYREIDATNKTVRNVGIGVCALGVGGYFLYRKIKGLTDRVKALETRKKDETER